MRSVNYRLDQWYLSELGTNYIIAISVSGDVALIILANLVVDYVCV